MEGSLKQLTGVMSWSGFLLFPDVLGPMIAKYLQELPSSRLMELEADTIGLFLMASAGYNPESAIRAHTILGEATPFSSGTAMDYVSTHPSTPARIENIEVILPLVKERYKAALRQGQEGTWGAAGMSKGLWNAIHFQVKGIVNSRSMRRYWKKS
eukprot:PhF_6_TR5122/c1_g1_i2/m.7261